MPTEPKLQMKVIDYLEDHPEWISTNNLALAINHDKNSLASTLWVLLNKGRIERRIKPRNEFNIKSEHRRGAINRIEVRFKQKV